MRKPEPPSRARATKPTRQRTVSMPLYSARPPQTPPSIESVPLRRSWGRGRGPGVGSVVGGGNGVAEVMRQACSVAPSRDIREGPDPSLVLPSRECPEGAAPRAVGDPTAGVTQPPKRQGPDGRCRRGPAVLRVPELSRAAPGGGRRR